MNQQLPRLSIALLFTLLLSFANRAKAQKLNVYDLNVEHQINPTSVDSQNPRFSWKLNALTKNTMQTNYEIRMGKNPKITGNGMWRSTKNTDQSVLVEYDGAPLSSKTKYYWQVRVKDNHGNISAWSVVQFFQTGLKAADWSAKWIAVPGQDDLPVSPLFRKTFTLSKNIRFATIYVTAKGLYEANINGKRVGDYYFAPGWTSYRKHLQYQVYDVTSSIKKGANAIGLTLGNGWYKGRIGFGYQHNFYGDTRALLFQLEVEYTDGTKETINSDDSWKTSNGPILASDVYDGEIYDARQEKIGWTTAPYKEDASWKAVRIIDKGTEQLVGMSGPLVKKHETFKALKIFKTPKGETVVDFGQNMVGWVMLKAKGPAGTKIILSHTEVLDKAGNFYTENLRSAKSQDHYILKGDQEQVFEPHFTFHGFRYVKVEGYPGELKLENLTGVALYSDMEATGKFSTSSALLNQLQHNIQWGQKEIL